MLSSLEIQNFKCFSNLKVGPLAKVNLFVGAGNAGKTSLLEAISWLPQQTTVQTFEAPKPFRDQSCSLKDNQELQRWLFHDLDGGKDIRVVATLLGNQRAQTLDTVVGRHQKGLGYSQVGKIGHKTINWATRPGDYRPAIQSVNTDGIPAEHLAKSFDRWTLKTENEGHFIRYLQAVEPHLNSLRPMEPHGRRMMYADVGLPERIPLPMLGEGFNRLLQVFGVIIGEGTEIVLVDEIENGLHWKALPQVWAGLKAAVSTSKVQIFATTHSYECLKAAIEVFRGEPRGELAVHRLERRDDGEIHCVTIEEEALERMLDRNWEVR